MKSGVAIVQFGARFTVPNVARVVWEKSESQAVPVVGTRLGMEDGYDLYVPIGENETVVLNEAGPYYEAVVTLS